MKVKNRIHPEKRAGIETNVPLHLHVHFDQQRVCTFYTGFRCDISQWNADKQKMSINGVNKAGQTSSYVNLHLKAIRAAVDTWAKENPTGTKDDLLKHLRLAAGKKDKTIVIEVSETFFSAFDEFLTKHPLSDVRRKNFRVLKRALQRFEMYKSYKNKFILTFDNLTVDVLKEFEIFLTQEHVFCTDYPELYKAIPESRTPQPRGRNTLNDLFTKLRTFIIWANKKDATTKIAKTTNNAFSDNGFRIEESLYGTPFYISIEERNDLYNFDFSHRPQLATQRDIFVFQCLVGCRVGDMYAMTRNNVIDGAIQYVARKTADTKKITVQVPLTKTALEILERYPDGKTLLPFISEQKYNVYIKEMFSLAGLTRIVTVINPTTGEAEQRPLNELASSHLARRCFVGNLYKKVLDPNLVGAMSGHKQGSKAFARYREIDRETLNNTVNMLE